MADDTDDPRGPSLPWERPAHWDAEAEEPSHVEELLARFEGADDQTPGPRRRRRADDDTDGISASELIAALRAGAAGQAPAAAAPPPEAPQVGEAPAPVVHDDGPGPHGWLLAARTIAAIVTVVLLIGTGTGWLIKVRADATLAQGSISALDPGDSNISDDPDADNADADNPADGAASDERTYRAENILLLGSDSRASLENAHLGGANTDPGGSDVVMVMHLSADRSHVTIVSIPRDMYITAPTCKAWDYTTNTLSDQDYVTPYSVWRMNSTFSVGGPLCTTRAVQQISGLRIDRVIVMDFAGFKSMVDALGGITVNACEPIVDRQLGTVLPVAGEQHINGSQALALVRARKVIGDTTSDLARIQRQQKVLATILRQVISAGTLLNPLKLDAVLQAFVSNVQSDNVTMDDLLEIADSFGDLDPARVSFYTLPTTADPDGIGLQPTDSAPLVWEALREDRPIGDSTTTTTAPPSTTDRSTSVQMTQQAITSTVTTTITEDSRQLTVAPGAVDLQVVNATGRAGVATTTMNALRPLGFSLRSSDLLLVPGDVRSPVTVEYSPEALEAALTVASAVPGSSLVEVAGLGARVRLILGSTFSGEVVPVAVGDTVDPSLLADVDPVVRTETREVVTSERVPVTPSAPATPAPATPTPATPGVEVGGEEISSINAGTAGCI